jgi:proton glutamate symport protein
MKIKKEYIIFSFIAGIIILINTLQLLKFIYLPHTLMSISRWTLVIILAYFSYQRKSLTWWTFTGMLAGACIGHDFSDFAMNLDVLSKIFIRLIKTIIAPLLFSTLVVGIAGHSNLKQVGRMGWKSLLYFEVITTVALVIGLLAINITKAGVGLVIPENTNAIIQKVEKQDWQQIVQHIFPENIAKSIAEGQVLEIVVFSVLFGIGLAMVKDSTKKQTMLSFTESLSEVMFKFTHLIMYFAPIGIMGAVAVTVAKSGITPFYFFGKLVLTLYVALFVFAVVVFIPILIYCKVNLFKFVKAISEPVTIAFGTASSEAALPSAMEALVNFGVPKKIVSFVLPTGYSFNLDGTTLYLALASVFVAQAAGIHMPLSTQIVMMLTLMLTSKGVAGVRGASLVILMGTAAQFNLPEKIILAMLSIDALMDMARTAVNVTGNCIASIFIAKWEGEFPAINQESY